MWNATFLNKPTHPKPEYLSEAVPNDDREGLGMVNVLWPKHVNCVPLLPGLVLSWTLHLGAWSMTRVRARRVVPCILASAHCSGFRALRHAASQLGTYILSQCNCTNSSNTEMKYGELFSCQCSLGSVGWDACRTRAADPVCWDLGSIRRRMLHVLQLGASELSSVPHSGIEALVNTQPRPAFETASSWKLPFFFCTFCAKAPLPWLDGDRRTASWRRAVPRILLPSAQRAIPAGPRSLLQGGAGKPDGTSAYKMWMISTWWI